MKPRRSTATILAFCLAVGVALSACVSGTGFLPGASRVDEPWQIPDDAFPTQRLFRIHYEGPEGELSFRLTLYLESRHSFRMDASDTLGRKVWSLIVADGGEGLWLDHREDLYCAIESAEQQSFVPIAYLPLIHLPRLILGRMPAEPYDDLRRGEGLISYQDRSGQLWSGRLDANGRVQWWSLVEGGAAVAWWRLEEEGDEGSQVFVDSRRGQEVRWIEQVRETLAQPIPSAEIPRNYDSASCTAPSDEGQIPSGSRTSSGAVQDVSDPLRTLIRGDG
ncbi:MAG: hypothetical protein MPN21_08330 [Thermoanaerobaculia bacterium]|nr:hypothetical protein [Thermoanaerobaculia bacterium]